jgi:hypothetical protein
MLCVHLFGLLILNNRLSFHIAHWLWLYRLVKNLSAPSLVRTIAVLPVHFLFMILLGVCQRPIVFVNHLMPHSLLLGRVIDSHD